MLIALLFFTALFLAYSNGANDNFKGVATLYGSRTVNYKTAITIATLATFAGSICAIFLAQGLIASFSGKGLVPQSTAGAADFLMAVGMGAACTVLLATRLGLPISTTHSLIGGLLGAGLMAVGWDINFHRLGGTFFIPLVVSPFIAFALAALAYWIFHRCRQAMGISKESCICVGEQRQFVPVAAFTQDSTISSTMHMSLANPGIAGITVTVADSSECVDVYTDRVWGIHLQKLLDFAHVVSAATVSFARGLNDTPKIAGLLVAASALNIQWGMVAIAIAMAIGGLLNAQRVAETMSKKITTLNHGQGFSANLVTGLLVIVASKFGVPVSTTHVSVGSIFGIGMVSGDRNAKVIIGIILSWLITLPVAMAFSAIAYFFIT